MKGIDISSYQGCNIDFNAVKNSGVDIVIIKATESTEYLNMYFDYQVQGVINAGIKFGFYHFFQGNGIAEADYFCNAIEPYKDIMDVKPVIDVEIPLCDINNQTLLFINRVKERLGLDCLIYSGAYFAGDNLTDPELTKYGFWVAHYDTDTPAMKGIWKDYVGHQYTDSGIVDGITGGVDSNIFTDDILINKPKQLKENKNYLIGGIYNMAGKINMRAKYKENGIDVWTRWYDMDKEACIPYKNIVGIEIYTDLPLKWGVCMNGKYVNIEGSGIIEGTEIYGFQAYLTDKSEKTYYWVSSPGDVEGYEWWCNNCKSENVPAVCVNTGGCSPLNAIKLRTGK